MRAVIQRVTRASVTIDGTVRGQIGQGLVVLLGVGQDDGVEQARWLAEKIIHLRIFQDDAGKLNRDLIEVSGALLVISQFTLFGDCRKGRRPSFIDAAPAEKAIPLYQHFIESARALGVLVHTGEFGADMQVELVNDGPVTLIVENPITDSA